jgi:HSP20 family protein
MSGVKVEELGEGLAMLVGPSADTFRRIEQRAYYLFRGRGCVDGQDRADWVQAEREILCSPPVELIEDEKEFHLRVAAAGFSAKDIHVLVAPETLVVRAEVTHKCPHGGGNVRVCEFGGRALFRRIHLPARIDVNQLRTSFENGILHVAVKKAVAQKQGAHSMAA